jgi:DNA-binding transcriptional ArsR family regulator
MSSGEPAIPLRDPAVMRALAHPARLAIIGHLSNGATVTATECAEIVGLSPSATSYHLRALAKAGLIREAPGRGDGRERMWTSALGRYQVASDQTTDPELREAEDQLVEAFMLLHEDQARKFMAQREEEPPEWYRVAAFEHSMIEVTVDELAELNDQVGALLEQFRASRRRPLPPGTRTVSVSFRAFPVPKMDVKH